MSKSQAFRINFSLLIIFLVSIFAVMATKAYFTVSADSQDNVFVSGNLELTVLQDNVLSVLNWGPGEEYLLEFNVENTGSLPVYLKGYFAGEWDLPELGSNYIEITKLEKLVNGSWVEVTQGGLAIDEEFFISADGTENSLSMLMPQESETLRLFVKLSEAVSDEYQNRTYTGSLHIAGKQVSQGASWPATY